MSQLNKVASVCADVFLKRAMPAAATKIVREGDSVRSAIMDLAKTQQRAANVGSMPDWLKMVLGIGGGSVVLDKMNDNKSPGDWRR